MPAIRLLSIHLVLARLCARAGDGGVHRLDRRHIHLRLSVAVIGPSQGRGLRFRLGIPLRQPRRWTRAGSRGRATGARDAAVYYPQHWKAWLLPACHRFLSSNK